MARWFRLTALSVVVVLIGLALAACGAAETAPAQNAHAGMKMAAIEQLPLELQRAAPLVRDAYRLTLVNQEVLSQIPCYCGCNKVHANVKECFVDTVQADGTVIWDAHGSGCGICQNTVHDSLQMYYAGKPLVEVRAYIDATYSRFGPGTNTPPVRN